MRVKELIASVFKADGKNLCEIGEVSNEEKI